MLDRDRRPSSKIYAAACTINNQLNTMQAQAELCQGELCEHVNSVIRIIALTVPLPSISLSPLTFQIKILKDL